MLRIASVAVALTLGAAAVAQAKAPKFYDLQPKSTKGTTAWFVATESHENEIMIARSEVNMNLRFTSNCTFGITIKQVDAKGNRIIEVYVARVAGWTQVGDAEKATFDSEVQAADVNLNGLGDLAHRLKILVGQRFVTRIDANGKLIGSSQTFDHLVPRKGLNIGVHSSEVADLVESVFGRTPVKPTPIGGTWKFVVPGDVVLRVARHGTLKLAKVTDDTFEMSLAGTVVKGAPRVPTDDPKSIKIARDSAKRKFNNSKLTGRQVLSRRDGLVIETESKTSFEVDMNKGRTQGTTVLVTTKLRRIEKPTLKPRNQKRRKAR